MNTHLNAAEQQAAVFTLIIISTRLLLTFLVPVSVLGRAFFLFAASALGFVFVKKKI